MRCSSRVQFWVQNLQLSTVFRLIWRILVSSFRRSATSWKVEQTVLFCSEWLSCFGWSIWSRSLSLGTKFHQRGQSSRSLQVHWLDGRRRSNFRSLCRKASRSTDKQLCAFIRRDHTSVWRVRGPQFQAAPCAGRSLYKWNFQLVCSWYRFLWSLCFLMQYCSEPQARGVLHSDLR